MCIIFCKFSIYQTFWLYLDHKLCDSPCGHFHGRAYEKAIESYATAVILAEDSNEENFNSDFSGIDGQSSFSDGSAAAAYNKLLFIAIANSGLGLCYLKIHEYSRAVDYLKAAIGHMTDDMFNRTVVTPRRKVPFMQSNIVGDSEDTPANKGCEQQILTLATATTRAYHLLSALEYLSDAYAAMREWEKAMYTANCSIEVCQCFLAIIRPCSTPHTIGLNEEGTPTGAIEQDVKMKSSSIEIKEHVALALRVRSTVSIDECGADDLHAERESHVKAIRRKCAAASLAKGHMMKKILYHDINRTDGSGEVAEGYTFAGLDKNLSSEPLYRPSHDSSTTHNVGVSAVEVIAALWNESAAEFNRLGDIDEAYSVYKDVAALWGTLAAFEPYSDSFFLIESSSLMSVKDGTDEPSVASSNSLTTERDDVCTSCTSSIAESVVRNALPVQPTSTENIRRIEAAVKAKDAWITAADVARQLCKHVPGGGVSGAKEDEEESLKNMDSADIRRFDLEMSSWRQVIQCQYYAGLCAMLHGMAGAEVLFEEAQETKGTYQDIAGALSEAEKREELRDVAGPVSNGKSPDGAHESDSGSSHVIPDNLKSDRKEFTKKSWLSYNTLCCDISYHLAYTYLREKKVAYAIAEAEMAIGFALRSTDSKMRRRKCWGLLALGFHASGQTPETDRALTEARQLRLGNSVDDAGMGDDEYLKLLHLFMEHNSSSRKAKKSLTDAVKLTDDKEEVELIHPVQAAPGDSSLFLSLLNMKHFDRRSLFFLFLGASSFLVLFFSICVAFMM